jgi:hypothetical protein
MPTPPRHTPAVALAALVAAAGLAAAQSASEVDRASRAHAGDVERAQTQLPDEPRAPAVVRPTPAATAAPPRPGLAGGFSIDEALRGIGVDVPPAAALPEGAFLTRRVGTAYAGPNGTVIFLPDPASRSPGEGAMVLAPNSALERLLASFAEGQTEARFALSGEVLLYRGRNHLLVSTFSRAASVEATPTAAGAPTEQPGDAAESEHSRVIDPTVGPSVDELIDELERLRSTAAGGPADAGDPRFRQLDRIDPAARRRPNQTRGLIPEDTMIVQRRARLDRTPDGRWVVTFDNDTDPAAVTNAAADSNAAPPAMTLIPSAVLQRMEVAAELFGDTAALTVSGRVLTYDGENYLRPTLFVLERSGDVDPMQ